MKIEIWGLNWDHPSKENARYNAQQFNGTYSILIRGDYDAILLKKPYELRFNEQPIGFKNFATVEDAMWYAMAHYRQAVIEHINEKLFGDGHTVIRFFEDENPQASPAR